VTGGGAHLHIHREPHILNEARVSTYIQDILRQIIFKEKKTFQCYSGDER